MEEQSVGTNKKVSFAGECNRSEDSSLEEEEENWLAANEPEQESSQRWRLTVVKPGRRPLKEPLKEASFERNNRMKEKKDKQEVKKAKTDMAKLIRMKKQKTLQLFFGKK